MQTKIVKGYILETKTKTNKNIKRNNGQNR